MNRRDFLERVAAVVVAAPALPAIASTATSHTLAIRSGSPPRMWIDGRPCGWADMFRALEELGITASDCYARSPVAADMSLLPTPEEQCDHVTTCGFWSRAWTAGL
jgi:hypothetical protein